MNGGNRARREGLSHQLGEAGLRRIDAQELRRFRQSYSAYPQIREAVAPVLAALPVAQLSGLPEIRESVTPESQSAALAGTSKPPALDPRLLLERLSFTHFAELVQIDVPQSPQQLIRDPYVFEFLGLRPQKVMTERKLEGALLDRLQHFLIELGRGFCFEARQSACRWAANTASSTWSS